MLYTSHRQCLIYTVQETLRLGRAEPRPHWKPPESPLKRPGAAQQARESGDPGPASLSRDSDGQADRGSGRPGAAPAAWAGMSAKLLCQGCFKLHWRQFKNRQLEDLPTQRVRIGRVVTVIMIPLDRPGRTVRSGP
jgi:hypothetical protein